jgi:hypothetical protein
MKTIRFYLYLLVFFCANSLFAQEEIGNGLLFPRFEEGLVIFKNGVRSTASLNYDMMQQQMLFLQADSTVMAIANPLDIIVMIISERRFVPVSSKGVFYEEIKAGEGSFFVERIAKMLSQGKAAAYGGYSQTQSSTSFNSWQDTGTGSYSKLKVDEKFSLNVRTTYYLQSGNSYKRFSSDKTLGKLFKGNESKIETFAKEQSINFSKTDDIARIVEYGYSLK